MKHQGGPCPGSSASAVSARTPSLAPVGVRPPSDPPDHRSAIEAPVVVFVSYESRNLVEELLDLWDGAFEVLIIDNSGNRDGIADLASRPGVRFMDGGGQGFARAANVGTVAVNATYVAHVNPDSRPTVDDIMRLTEGLADDPTALSHSATSTDIEGDVEIGVGGWEPTVGRAWAFGMGLHKLCPKLGIYARPRLGERLEVDWTSGACMVVRRSDFLAVGGYDEGFFVYSEDVSLGRRARNVGLRQVLREDVVIPHDAGNSGAPSAEMLRMRGASIANYVIRYHPVAAPGVRTALAVGYSLRAVQRRLAGNPEMSRLFRAYVRGVVTRKANVGGVEVALARFRETELTRA